MKVKRKYVELSSSCGSENYHPETGATQGAINRGYSNSGYRFFPSLEAVEEYLKTGVLRKEVESEFQGYQTSHIPNDCIKELHAVLVAHKVISNDK